MALILGISTFRLYTLNIFTLQSAVSIIFRNDRRQFVLNIIVSNIENVLFYVTFIFKRTTNLTANILATDNMEKLDILKTNPGQ